MGAHDPRSAQDMSTVHNLCSPVPHLFRSHRPSLKVWTQALPATSARVKTLAQNTLKPHGNLMETTSYHSGTTWKTLGYNLRHTYLYFGYHLWCSMTKLQDHIREICYFLHNLNTTRGDLSTPWGLQGDYLGTTWTLQGHKLMTTWVLLLHLLINLVPLSDHLRTPFN